MIRSDLDFSALKRRVSIQEVLEAEGLTDGLRRQGNRLVGPCPLHGGDNPRAFVASLDVGLWHCFTRCGRGGDIVELLRCSRDVDYREAAEILAVLASGRGPKPQPIPRRPRPAHRDFPPFRRTLPLDPQCSFLQRKGITPETARAFEAGWYDGRGLLADCIAVRLRDSRGAPLGYAGRRRNWEARPDHGKWVFPPRLPKSRLLYNYHCVRDDLRQGVVVVEDPWSVMRLAQLDIPAVAILGTSLSVVQGQLLAQARRCLLLLDGDHAGRAAAQMLPERLHTQTRIVTLPEGFDPDDLSDAKLLSLLRPFFPF